jgi:hypothetical protein
MWTRNPISDTNSVIAYDFLLQLRRFGEFSEAWLGPCEWRVGRGSGYDERGIPINTMPYDPTTVSRAG